MKKLLVASLVLISSASFAGKGLKPQPKILMKLSQNESDLRKAKSELFLRTRQVKQSTKALTELTNNYSKLQASHRKLIGEYQILRYQNEQLINGINKSGALTPELAKKIENMKGRLPASFKKKGSRK